MNDEIDTEYGKSQINYYKVELSEGAGGEVAYGRIKKGIFCGYTLSATTSEISFRMSKPLDFVKSIRAIQRLDHILRAKDFVQTCERHFAGVQKAKLAKFKLDAQTIDIDEETGDPLFIGSGRG